MNFYDIVNQDGEDVQLCQQCYDNQEEARLVAVSTTPSEIHECEVCGRCGDSNG